MKRTLLLFELIYMWLFAYSSESINFKTLEVKDGLFYNYAHAILQDSDGFMWFLSGKNMLNRYDGYNFKKYPINTLNGSGDLALREDKNKNIWITEKNRFLIYDRENDCLKRDISTVLPPGINQGDISSLFVDYDGNVWFTIQNRLSCYDMGSNKCTEFMLEDKLKWLECRSGHAYLLLENGEVQEANITTGQIRKHLSLFLSSYPHHKMYIDHTLNLWIYTLHSSEDSLLYYNTQTKELKTITNQNNENYYFVTDIIDDKKGNIWIGTDNVGISIYNMNNHTYTEVKANTYNDFSIPTNHINCFHLDKQNVMWVGTSKRGVAYTNLNNTSFNQQFTFGMDDISCILEDHDKNIWLGSDGQGIACINQKKNKFTHYTHQNSTIPGDLIVCSFLDSKGRVWFGSYGGGVFYYEKGEFHQLLYKGESPTTNPLKEIRSINEDINGNIWIGTIVDGLYCYETDGTFSSYTVENSPLSSNGITDICCQQSENIYVATTEDLHVINSYSRQISTFSTHSKKEQLSTTFISSIFKDSRELLWLGGDKGIIVYNERQDTLIYINSKNGLSHNSIRGIYEDHNKNMWITTDNGVTNVTVNNSLSPMPAFRCYRYYDEDGLGNITFNTHSIYCCQNGDILMGGMGGYIQISPKEVQYPPQTSQITFTALYIANKQIEVGEEVNGRVILPQNIQLIDEITLDYSNNNFAVSVSSLSYQSLHKNSFSYRLTGNKEWVKLDENLISFNKLQPGTYKLEVKANDQEISKNSISSLTIHIKPPFLQSPTAYFLYVILILVFIIFWIYYLNRKTKLKLKMQQLKLEVAKQQEIDEAQMRFFTNVSHDLRTPLSLIITPLERLISQEKVDNQLKEDLELMHRNAGILMEEINQLLDLRRLDNGKESLKLSHGNISDFVKKVCQPFEPYSQKQGVKLILKLQSPTIEMDFDAQKVQRILINLLSNAYKFNVENGSITITVDSIKSEGNKLIRIHVADTGIGIAAENKERIFERFYQGIQPNDYIGSGVGLNIVKEYVNLHGGSITVTDNTPQGSIFTVTLPINNNIPSTEIVFETTRKEEQTTSAEYTQAENEEPILIVEDNEDFRKFLAKCLKGHHQVITASNGLKAFSIIKRQPVKMVISDIMMPVMDGLTLCNKIKEDINFSHIPIILLTAKAADEHILNGLREGADDYITKPFNIDIFLLRIQKLLERKIINHYKFNTIEIEPSEITISSLDEKLISKAIKLVEENISEPAFSVEELSSAIGMTRGHLYKKLVAITGKSPVEFIRTIRIKRGKLLLEKSQQGVTEIAYEIGLSPKQFAKYFKEAYGKLPSEYKKAFSTRPSFNL